jgi:hypothetical protein
MRQLINSLDAGETYNVFGEVRKIKLRSASGGLEIRTSKGDVFPIREGDLISLDEVSQGLSIRNLDQANNNFEVILMSNLGASYESSAGVVEVAGVASVAEKGAFRRVVRTHNLSSSEYNVPFELMAENSTRKKAVLVFDSVSGVADAGFHIGELETDKSNGLGGYLGSGSLEDESISSLWLCLEDLEKTGANPWPFGEKVARVTVVEYCEIYNEPAGIVVVPF